MRLGRSSGRWDLLALLAITLCTWLTFASALRLPTLLSDDWGFLLRVRQGSIFAPGSYHFIPGFLAFWKALDALSGGDPRAFGLANLLLHSANGAGLYALVVRLQQGRRRAFLVALLAEFGVRPVYTLGGVLAADVLLALILFVVARFLILRPVLPQTRKVLRDTIDLLVGT